MRELSEFLGPWRLLREITDFSGGPMGRMSGTARFDLAGPADLIEGAVLAGDVVLRESGTLRLGDGAAMAAQRSYIWRAMGDQIAVLFEDGRDFHHFERGAVRPEAHHDCPPDIYDVRYEFAGWPGAWRAIWRVRGPRKDYESRTDFTRESV
ncbi:MAG: hypothetical protein ACJA06_001498 [Halocynthiibacter sp.]|jgi:hypothetical protein